MKEIHLGRILSENRRRKGITQDELAEFMGVSKAAVSKWETESTYPDILLLPRLAAYFDMSIDGLMGYEPQMDKREIRETHRRLSEEFTTLPFEEALEHCREYAREYYSCYPLVFQIGSLLVNHFMLAQSAEAGEQILGEASELFRRVKEGTDDPGLGKEALHMEAYCLLLLRRPEEVLELLKEKTPVTSAPEPLLASAWKQTGDRREARRVLQIGIYREVIALLNLLTSYMELCREEPGKYRETCRRLTAAADAFDMDQLHPGIMMPCYIDMAQGWAALGEGEKALACLEKYTDLAAGDIYPLRLHGDAYFDLLDEWFDSALDLGDYPPRDEAIICRSMTQALTENPAFVSLAAEPRFQNMVERLKQNEGHSREKGRGHARENIQEYAQEGK